MIYRTVGVHVISLPFYADRLFEYYLPTELSDSVKLGSFVTVPFGGSNKKMNAVVFALAEREDISELKPIDSVNRNITLTEEELRLCLFVKEQTFCSVADAVKQIIPAEAMTQLTTVYKACPPSADRIQISKNALIVYSDILQKGEVSAEKLIASYGEGTEKILARLSEYGYIEKVTHTSAGKTGAYEEYIHIAVSDENYEKIKLSLKGSKQQAIIGFLHENGSASYELLREKFGQIRSTIDGLIERKYISSEKRARNVDPYKIGKTERRNDFKLSDLQRSAFERLSELIETNEPKAALLHGVTGSGKTMVIKALIDKVIAAGKQVIVLVPEISLTPQTVSFFSSFYSQRTVVIHSSLSRGERFDAWRRIKNGEIDICIGTRSAVFAPFNKLGMIVIDEEHEHTYKSDQTPRYHARDIARFRCAYNKALMLLASATPSVESYYKACSGIYTLVELDKRYNNSKLPETVICDMRLDTGRGRLSPIGTVLEDALKNTFENSDQAILFVNRRGYNNYLSCRLCGNVLTCPHCSVSLTYHTGSKGSERGYLICHYCGYREPVPKSCPECGSDDFSYMGFGTQKAESELSDLFPNIRISRLDADTASAKFASDRLLDSFRKKESDVLIGTQMVTKGHNFPDVTLVGVLSADDSLYVSDYRAGERTFALITQVIGRAGRGDKPGTAIIQTYSPDNPILIEAAAQNYKDFYNNEIAMRKSLVFPPFCDIALITLTSSDEKILSNTVAIFAKQITHLAKSEYSDIFLQIFGPFEAPVYRVNETYRMRFIVKCCFNKMTKAMLASLMFDFTKNAGKKINLSIDINPSTV